MARNCSQAIYFVLLVFAVFLIQSVSPTAKAQMPSETLFSKNDIFSIPDFNGSIRFALNGSYSQATLSEDVWKFTDLRLNNSQTIGNLTLGAKDSNITIFSLRTSNFTGRSTFVRYQAVGEGTQTVDLHPASTRQTHWSEWSVTVPGASGTVWLSEGKNWDLRPDNTVVVWGLTGNVSVVHYNFMSAFPDSNSPFLSQHSIAALTAVVLTAVITMGLVIRTIRRRR